MMFLKPILLDVLVSSSLSYNYNDVDILFSFKDGVSLINNRLS